MLLQSYLRIAKVKKSYKFAFNIFLTASIAQLKMHD